ncbi:MAG: alcohol acetyltransferase, partial [Ruminococcus sp.]|nr:alcohol acetyltransferase [Ruminococcus sp.]
MSNNNLFWLRLDNAAKLYPAVKTKNWCNVFRLSVTISEKIDPDILQSALNVTVRRFPSISMKLCKGFFWYYLEASDAPEVIPEKPYPCSKMTPQDLKKCAFRVLYYECRIAVEFFHSLTDGNGGLIFLKTLLAEYLSQKNNMKISFENGVLDCTEIPNQSKFEDSFLKYDGIVSYPRNEATAYQV